MSSINIAICSLLSSVAYERAVLTTKSAIIALALVKKRLSVEQAAQAAHVEVNSQIERWGEVEDCEYLIKFCSRALNIVQHMT